MGGEKRVPQKDSEFDQYIRNTTNVLENGTPTGAVRLGLTTAQGDAWIDFRDQWIIIYPQFTDPAQRTSSITNIKNTVKKNFTTFAEIPLKVIEVSANLTENDRKTFRLPLRDRTMTQRGAIDDVPFGSVRGKGGGILEVRTRREQDATRSSMHPLSDVVEFRYKILGLDPEPPLPVPVPPGDSEPPLPESLPHNVTSKKALFRINLTTAAINKRIIGYLRWVNLSKPENNSGWSDMITTIVT